MNKRTRVRLAVDRYPDLLSIFQEFADPKAEVFAQMVGIVLSENEDHTYKVSAFGEELRISFSIDFRNEAEPLGRIDARWVSVDANGKETAPLVRSIWYDSSGKVLNDRNAGYSLGNLLDQAYIGEFVLDTLSELLEVITMRPGPANG